MDFTETEEFKTMGRVKERITALASRSSLEDIFYGVRSKRGSNALVLKFSSMPSQAQSGDAARIIEQVSQEFGQAFSFAQEVDTAPVEDMNLER